MTEPPPASFAALLRKLRIDAGLTQEKLAESAQISHRSVSDLERGINRGPRADTLRLLADALGLTGDVRAGFETVARQHIPATREPPGGRPTPSGMAAATRTLPRDIASFTGRHPEIESLLHTGPGVVTPAPVVEICAIGGMAGVGKTALAVHVAHRLADRFPDGQIFLQLHGHTPGQRPVDPADALASLLQAAGIPAPQIPVGLEPRAWLWRDQLAGKRVLLLLDDAVGHEQIRPLLPGSPGTLVLITSRRHLTALEDAEVISLDTLPAADAAALLVRLAGRPGLDPASNAIGEIARLCGYLPLAVGMLARQLHHHPAWTAGDLAAELSAARDRLELMRAENLSVAAAFDLSFRELPADEQRLFRYLGLHSGTDFDDYAAAALAGVDLAATRRQISDLYDHYVLSEPARGRYRMHDLIAEYARALGSGEPAADRDAAVGRLLGYYLHTTRIAGRQLTRRTPAGPPAISSDPPAHWPEFFARSDATAWLDAEQVNLRAAVSYAAAHAQAGYAIEIPSAMHGYLRHHGDWPQVLALHDIAIDAARRLDSPQAEANALTDIGDIHYLLGDYTAAASSLIPAIEIHRRHENDLGLAHALTILGYVRYLSGENDAAHDSLTDALERYRRLGDQLGQAGTLAYLSRVHLASGNYPAAKTLLNQGLELYRGLGGIVEASLFYYLGVAQEATGDCQAATESITQALQLQRDAGNPHGQLEALTYLALAQHNSGDFEAAETSLEEARLLSHNLGIRQGHDLALWPLDHVRYRIPENSLSTASLSYAVDVYARLGLLRDEAATLNALGQRALLAGDLLDAYAYHQRASLIAREIGSLPAEADALDGAGRCLLRLGKREAAAARLQQALAIYERIGSPRAEAVRATFRDSVPAAELQAAACENGPMAKRWDAVVVGGGHNGLVAAAYLARAGLDTLVLERREVIGGASVSEHPFGPEWTVTSLSYVLSLLPPDISRDLGLDLTIYPQGPYFAPRRDGRALRLPSSPRERHAEIARFSARDADAYEDYEAHLAGLARILAPLLEQIPPRLGSRRPADLLAQARLAAQLRNTGVRGAVDVTRLLTGSIADLLDRYFESDAVRGVLSVSGVIGTWAGPRSAGTAYVMLHHHIGEADGQTGVWGFPRGGMGAVAGAIAAAAGGFGVTIRTDAEVAKIRVAGGRVAGVTLASGEEIDAGCVVTTAHPAISFLRLLDRADLPAEFVADIENWQTRSGTVKINLALDRLPIFTAHPDPDPDVYGGTIVLSESLDDVENAFQEAVSGKPSTFPFADICIPSVFDGSLAPAGKHVMSLFTQWVPRTYADAPDEAALSDYADRVIARVEAVAPGFTDCVLHRQVIGPHVMQQEYGLVGGNIFHGELSLGQLFHARPAAGYADLRTPVPGLYQAGSSTHGGGGVTGIPGRNVVRQILADRRAERWRRRLRR